MKDQAEMQKYYQIKPWVIGLVLIPILILSACASPNNVQPTETRSQPDVITTVETTSTGLADTQSPELITVNVTATLPDGTQSAGDLIPVSGGGDEIQSPTTLTADELAVLQKLALPTDAIIKYTDDFKNSASGWLEGKSDSSTVGYSGGNFYAIKILKKDTKYSVYLPKKLIYDSLNIDLKVKTEKAQNGDFDYGLVFRRSGDQYYAFTISPRTGKWQFLKSSTDSLKILKEGKVDGIQGLNNAEDNLRVSLRGSSFFIAINGLLVTQVSDADYARGEIGLFVQTHDSPEVLIDFDSIILWTVPVKNGPTPGPNLVTVVPPSTLNCSDGTHPHCDIGYEPDCTCLPIPPGAYGCTDKTALNYSKEAIIDDGSCIYPPPTDPPPPPTDPPPPPPTDPPPPAP